MESSAFLFPQHRPNGPEGKYHLERLYLPRRLLLQTVTKLLPLPRPAPAQLVQDRVGGHRPAQPMAVVVPRVAAVAEEAPTSTAASQTTIGRRVPTSSA